MIPRRARKERLKQGQIIVLGTDGIWEAQNPEGKMFGKEAICRLIRENADADAEALLDDVTLIVVKIGKN
jgi:sigma-B regulation protein RsbU (phosphoserine phosphatase)